MHYKCDGKVLDFELEVVFYRIKVHPYFHLMDPWTQTSLVPKSRNKSKTQELKFIYKPHVIEEKNQYYSTFQSFATLSKFGEGGNLDS